MLEGGGRSVRSELAKPNPFPRPTCDRTDCPLADSENGCRERCYNEHAGYVGECTRCRVVQKGQEVVEVDFKAYSAHMTNSLYFEAFVEYREFVDSQSKTEGIDLFSTIRVGKRSVHRTPFNLRVGKKSHIIYINFGPNLQKRL